MKKKLTGLISSLFLILAAAYAVLNQGYIPDFGETETVYEDSQFSQSIVDENPNIIPEFAGDDYCFLNDNIPGFTDYDIENIEGQHFAELDKMGRCGTAYAMLDESMMPHRKRKDIGEIKPSGWRQKKYDGLVDADPPFIYNRSHLIAYALSGQEDNECNLITGTRYFNATTMLPYEETVMRYIEREHNHVLYRVSPLFVGDELVARGVEMEAYSVEDGGEGISYHVFVYNYQPGIDIDYKTGNSWIIK